MRAIGKEGHHKICEPRLDEEDYKEYVVHAHEKKHSPTLVERTKELLRRARLRCLVADSQYSSRMRGLVDEAMIPFMANQ